MVLNSLSVMKWCTISNRQLVLSCFFLLTIIVLKKGIKPYASDMNIRSVRGLREKLFFKKTVVLRIISTEWKHVWTKSYLTNKLVDKAE